MSWLNCNFPCKSTAAGLPAVTGSFAPDVDLTCTAAMILIMAAVISITNYIQLRFRCFKKVLKNTASVFRKACAAGIICTFCICAFYINRTFTAVAF